MECTIHTPECALDEEVIVLGAIYINELTVARCCGGHVTELRLVLHPATADVTGRQFVKITLVIRPSLEYPNQLPEINIEKSRGLSDSQLKCLIETLNLHAKDKRGWPMLHELIETAKDTLTAGNLPHCPCAICLDQFVEVDDIHKTVCYHYYHKGCLLEYVDYYRNTVEEASNDKKIPCPICREEIEVDLQVNVKKKTEEKETSDYVPDAYVIALQEKMQKLYMKQKESGGIIDLEAEKNKFLVQNGTVIVPPEYVQDTEERLEELMQQSRRNNESGENGWGKEKVKFGDKNERRGQMHSRGWKNQSREFRPRPDTRPKQRDRKDGERSAEQNSGRYYGGRGVPASGRRRTRPGEVENGEPGFGPRPRPDIPISQRRSMGRGARSRQKQESAEVGKTRNTDNCDSLNGNCEKTENVSTNSRPDTEANGEVRQTSTERRHRRGRYDRSPRYQNGRGYAKQSDFKDDRRPVKQVGPENVRRPVEKTGSESDGRSFEKFRSENDQQSVLQMNGGTAPSGGHSRPPPPPGFGEVPPNQITSYYPTVDAGTIPPGFRIPSFRGGQGAGNIGDASDHHCAGRGRASRRGRERRPGCGNESQIVGPNS